MRTTTTLWTTVACLVVVSAAQAGIIDLPVMYGQGPYDPNVSNVATKSNCAFSQIVYADDFISVGTQPIAAVRWWGAYGHADGHANQQVDAHISFHYAMGDTPFSYPHPIEGPPIVLYDVVATATDTGDKYLGIFPIYEYEAYLPVPFDHAAEAPQSPLAGELFIDIGIPDPDKAWWWIPMATTDPILDWSASSSPGHEGPWVGGEQYNLPFELMTPEPATLALMGLGAVTLVLSRRRHIV